jgi:flavin-dependent dehydrogenase
MLERGRFPRNKVCGEFVSAESLGLLRSLLNGCSRHRLRDAVLIPQARIFIDGRILSAPLDPPAASIARFNLDESLWCSAENNGVDARQEVTVWSVSGTGPFHLVTSAGEFESRAVVNASGRWSNFNVLPASETPKEKWLGLKGHFSERPPQLSVDLYFFDGGYCGMQPVMLQGADAGEGRINVCTMVRADAATTLAEVFALHPALQERSRRWQPLGEPINTAPLIFRRPQPVRDGILMTGDAAGFVDPFVGDGISLALRSGALAADSLAPCFAGHASLDQAVRGYDDAYTKSLLPVFRASSRIRRMLKLPRMARRPFLAILEKTPALRRQLVRHTR